MKIEDYAKWVRGQVIHHRDRGPVSPGDTIRAWSSSYSRVYRDLSRAHAVYELLPLVISRWQVFGCLYLGNTIEVTQKDAQAFCDEFLVKVNPRYAQLARDPNRLEIFSMLRNGPIHGLTPVPIARPSGRTVKTWFVGVQSEITAAHHLKMNRRGSLQVNASRLGAELGAALQLYAQYLDGNQPCEDGMRPQDLWRQAFWARFSPFPPIKSIGSASGGPVGRYKRWMNIGKKLGLPWPLRSAYRA